MVSLITPAESKKSQGQFVLDGQPLGKDFRNVSQLWLDQTHDYEFGINEILRHRSETVDIHSNMDKCYPTFDRGQFGFFSEDTARHYTLTEHALKQVCARTGVRAGYLVQLLQRNDPKSHEVLSAAMRHEWNRSNKEREFIFRTNGSTLRACLTTVYKPVDNVWVLEVVKEVLPGGRLSHWRGTDGDTIYTNVLIPDSIRSETDSDYGAMLSLSNCEIGIRGLGILPSLFRAICQNGSIWGKTDGVKLQTRHIGKKLEDLNLLKQRITSCINEQIPISLSLINKLVATKKFATDIQPLPLLATLSLDLKLSVKEARLLSQQYADNTEKSGSLFDLIDATTRTGQLLSNKRWVEFDTFGGRLLHYTNNDWDNFVSRARHIQASKVDKALGLAV